MYNFAHKRRSNQYIRKQMSEIYEFETDVKNSFYTANIGDEVFKLYELD